MMSKKLHTRCRRFLSSVLSVMMLAACVLPAAAAPIGSGVTSTYDEAYYATLDYYGNLLDGSVVKSYIMNGAATITDYGVYDQVINLTDGTSPSQQDGSTVFRFDENNAPSHFYFEGKTRAPFEDLPWTISISYTLNGVPTEAQDLAGKTGVVEIHADVIPNENASEYARYNYTLEAMALFNQDDILSLEAPGAQVQLIGNLRAVLFVALPGEEQHFVIRVGSEDFSFDGLTFLMVPATLSQLDEIAKLNERKDDLEENYNKLSGSMDELLSSFSSLGGSLRATADGLDQLNEARGTISAGKGQLYEQADQALNDLNSMQGSLDKLPGHLDSADQAVTDVTDSLSAVAKSAVSTRDDLDALGKSLESLQKDLKRLSGDSGDLDKDMDRIGSDLEDLRDRLDDIRGSVHDLQLEISGQALNGLPQAVQEYARINGQPLDKVLAEANEALPKLSGAWSQSSQGKSTIGYNQFAVSTLVAGGAVPDANSAVALITAIKTIDASLPGRVRQEMMANPQLTQEQATQLAMAALLEENGLTLEAYTQGKTVLAASEQVYQTVCGGLDKSMDRTGFFTGMMMMKDITAPEKLPAVLGNVKSYRKKASMLIELEAYHGTEEIEGLMRSLSNLLDHLGSDGAAGDLSGLMGHTQTAMGSLDDTADATRNILNRLDDILAEVETLDKTVTDHVPGIHDTLTDTRELLTGLSSTTGSAHSFLTTFRNLSQKAGTQLDAGTKQSLENLAMVLRRTANSTDAVGGVQSAKDSMSSIIEDTWDEFTGEHNNLLMIDSEAEAQSLTSDQNKAPTSVQVLIRTQEIKTEEAPDADEAPQEVRETTFWGRVAQMFRDFWHAVTGLFGRN